MKHNLSIPWNIVGGLSKPSKMPGYAYGIPAAECKTGATLVGVAGSTCSGCYALKGNYRFSNVVKAQYRRLASLDHPRWVSSMADLLRGKYGNSGYFRWHDSGDLQGVGHLDNIVKVAKLTPHVQHWIPTREYKFVSDYLDVLGDLPDNLCIRLSAHMIDQPVDIYTRFPVLLGIPTSTVHHGLRQPVPALSGKVNESIECKAYTRGNSCGPCRACWSKEVANVSYPKH